MDPLGITLFVVEEREQSGEGVGDGSGVVVVFEDLKHLETLVVICRTRILEEKSGVPAVLQTRPDLTLPELAGKGIGGVSDESRVGTGSGETGAVKPVEDEVACGKVVGGVLDHREGEAIDRKRDRARRGHHQRRGEATETP